MLGCAARHRRAAAAPASASGWRTRSARTPRRPGCGSTSPRHAYPTGGAARPRPRRRAPRRAAAPGRARRPAGRARRRRPGECSGWRPAARTRTRRRPRRE
jgi:hypothetical protein